MTTTNLSYTVTAATFTPTTINGTEQTTDISDFGIFESDLIWFMVITFMTCVWILYLVYYNSRMFGFLLTRIVNKFVTGGHVKIGSFSVSLLSGKVMFRDLHYLNEDCSVRVQDGWAIFRWWRPFQPMQDPQADMSHAETRLNLLLNGLECHIYNRSSLYSQMEKKFGLEPTMIPESETERKKAANQKRQEQTAAIRKKSKGVTWRDLVPVIKIDVSTGRVVFGNKLVPTTLTISMEDAHIVYTTKQASSPLDQFMHSIKCQGENVRAMLAPSPKYTGPVVDDPPRYMGEGFVVLQSNKLDMYYYVDEPGVVPEDNESNTDEDAPCWGMDVKCGKGTDISYGPWADRQRELLHKLFFPVDYQPMTVTKPPKPGDTRQCTRFDFRMNILEDATIDILFTKCKETNAIHMNIGAGSCVEVCIPWVVTQDGYKTKVSSQLLYLDSSTSLQYRSLIECETLQFTVEVHYPIIWNHHQTWKCDLTVSRGIWSLIFQHKTFLLDLMTDWSSKSRPDILSFTPYTWQFNIVFHEFELILPANQYNWVDCASHNQENVLMAICAEHFDLSFSLPFTDFIPETVPIKFWVAIENGTLRAYLPETNTSRHALLALDKSCKESVQKTKDAKMKYNINNNNNGKLKPAWRKVTQASAGWIDCWFVPAASLNICYTYYPLPPNEDIPMVLAPVSDVGRVTKTTKDTKTPVAMVVDPTTLPPDRIHVEFDVGPSEFYVYGVIFRHFYFLKENFFGEDQMFRDLSDSSKSISVGPSSSTTMNELDTTTDEKINPLTLRPLDVTVSVSVNDVTGYFPKHCGDKDGAIPTGHLEQLCFEMHKSYKETKLQLLISPVTLLLSDTFAVSHLLQRPESDMHLKEGHLTLSGLQVRGHAMFSGEGLPPTSETLEYGWLVEVQVGSVSGKVTIPQLQSVAAFAQMFVFLAMDSENTFQHTVSYKNCQHCVPQQLCTKKDPKLNIPCPLVEDVKYEMTRVSLDQIDLYLVDTGSACHIQVHPVRIATCNLHGDSTATGVTVMIRNIEMKQYIAHSSEDHHANTVYDTWLGAGGVSLGPIVVDAAMSLPHPELHHLQEKFLKIHDKKTKRLWFLWPMEDTVFNPDVIGKCGCLGGCKFFGNNSNGVKFFERSQFDAREGTSDSLFTVLPGQGPDSEQIYGYGQSLLEKGQLVFAVCERRRSPEGSPTRSNFKFTPGYVPMFSPSARRSQSGSIDNKITPSIHGSQTSVSKVSTQAQINHGQVKESDTNMPGHDAASRQSSGHSKTSIHSSGHDLHLKYLGGQPPLEGSCQSLPIEALRWDRTYPSARHHSLDMGDIDPIPGSAQESKSSVQFSVDSHLSGHRPVHATMSGQSVGSRTSQKSSLHSLSSSGQVRQAYSETSLTESEFYSAAEDDYDGYQLISSDDRLSLESQRILKDIRELTDPEAPVIDFDSSHDEIGSSTVHDSESSLSDNQAKSKSTSVSSDLSFVSAVESPSDLLPEHLARTDSYDRQVSEIDQPMTQYPGLMSCYANHLTQMHCSHWVTPPPSQQLVPRSPFAARTSLGSVASYESIQLPVFTQQQRGLGTKLLYERSGRKRLPSSVSDLDYDSEGSDTLVGLYRQVLTDKLNGLDLADETNKEETGERISAENEESEESQTTAIVQVRGSVDAMVSPLMVEAIQRYVEALTPQVSHIHPSAVLDNLHFSCLREVKAHHKIASDDTSIPSPKHKEKDDSPSKSPSCSVSKVSSLQLFVSVARVNLCVFQASLEDTALPASPEVIRQTSFVSILALSADNINTQLFLRDKSLKSVQVSSTHESPQSICDGKKNGKDEIPRKSGAHRVKFQGSGDLRDEIQTEELAAQVQISKLHCQFRKLPTPDEDLSKVVVTAVAEEQSKVMFTFDRELNLDLGRRANRARMGSTGSSDSECVMDSRKSWIMLECGIDDIGLKAGKRLGFGSVEYKSSVGGSHILNEINRVTPHKKYTPMTSTVKMDVPKARPKFYFQAGEDISSDETLKGEDIDGDLLQDSSSSSSSSSSESFHSRISFSTPEDSEEDADDEDDEDDEYRAEEQVIRDLPGNASNCVLAVSTVWFNVPSPPKNRHAQISAGQVFDSNLLSTATPAINAWLTPIDQISAALSKLTKGQHQRICGLMACIMADALDLQKIHQPFKSKYNKTTAWSKCLQDDPSCQLVTVLRRYLNEVNLGDIEDAVADGLLPAVSSLEKGVHALTRQWKVTLVAPGIGDFGLSSRKSVFYPAPHLYPMPPPYGYDAEAFGGEVAGLGMSEGDVNEKTALMSKYSTLENEPLSAASLQPGTKSSLPQSTSQIHSVDKPEYKITYEEFATRRRTSQTGGLASVPSNALYREMSDSPGRLQSTSTVLHQSSNMLLSNPPPTTSYTRKESNTSLSASGGSIDPLGPSSTIGTPLKVKQTTLTAADSQDPHLYSWMAQDQYKTASVGSTGNMTDNVVNPMYRAPNPFDANYTGGMPAGLESNTTTLGSSKSGREEEYVPHVPMSHAVQLADAQVLFKPLLTNMGLKVTTGTEPSQMSEKYGDISVACKLDCVKVDIVETEGKKDAASGKHRGKHKLKRGGQHSRIDSDQPAFICEDFIIEAAIRDVFHEQEQKLDHKSPQRAVALLPTEDDVERPTIEVHFILNIHSVTQHINMPLLRLATQVLAMVDNVKQTRTDLKLNRYTASAMSGSERYKGGRKHLSSTSGLWRNESRKRKLSSRSKLSPMGHNRQPSMSVSMRSTATDSDMSEQGSDTIPKCWQTMYHLLDLYSTMPDPAAYSPQNVFVNPLFFLDAEGNKLNDQTTMDGVTSLGDKTGEQAEQEHRIDIEPVITDPIPETQSPETQLPSPMRPQRLMTVSGVKEHTHHHVFGVVMVQRSKLQASLGGLTLEAELRKIHASITHKVKRKGASRRRSMESSASACLHKASIVLLERSDIDSKIIVKIVFDRSMGLYSASSSKSLEKAASVLSVGVINIDIPQHPAILHGMVARSTKKLSSQIQQLKRPMKTTSYDSVDGAAQSVPAPAATTPQTKDDITPTTELPQLPAHTLTKPTKMTFKVQMSGIAIGAALLPSLRANYRVGRIFSTGITGDEAHFSLLIPNHALSFSSKVSISDTNFPSSATIDFPPIEFEGQYKTEERQITPGSMGLPGKPITRYGSYLDAIAKVGSFEHSLTTDLLNHLIFVQKVFMKEVEEVVQKMAEEEKPVPLWSEHGKPIAVDRSKPVLFSLHFKIEGIQVTATTPASSAVRFETGAIELELSNRIQSTVGVSGLQRTNSNLKLFGKAQVDLNLALGELVRNQVFEEAEPEFQQMAYFKTRIGLRNALQDEISSAEEDKEALLISLKRPLFYVQPIAFDKAVLIYLNYKNAYENWHEQIILNKEVKTATQAVFERLPHLPQPDPKTLGTLFLQLTVDDLGLCMPMNSLLQAANPSSKVFDEHGSALVLTLESSLITACSSGSLVSTGIFKGFCLRFADDFETSLDDWKPDANSAPIMNACTVPEGTYEVCSRTTRKKTSGEHLPSIGKWILSILWKMEGIDVHLDTNVGHRLSAMFGTLTTFTGYAEDDDIADLNSVMEHNDEQVFESSTEDIPALKLKAPPVPTGGSVVTNQFRDVDPRQRALLIEKEMNEQAKVVQDLRDLGASVVTIEEETKRLQELEAAVFKDFRRDVRKKLRRQSQRATAIRDRFVPGYRPSSHHRSKSVAHSPGLRIRKGKKSRLDPSLLAEYNEEYDRLPMGHNRARSDGTGYIDSKVSFHAGTPRSPTNMLSQSMVEPEVEDMLDNMVEDDSSLLNATVGDPLHISARLQERSPRKPCKQASLPDMWDLDTDSSDEVEQTYLEQAKSRRSTPARPSSSDPRKPMIQSDRYVKPLGGFPAPKSVTPTPSNTSHTPSPGKVPPKPESNIDFEMDIKVYVDSGKLILHPNVQENAQEEEQQPKGRNSKYAKVNIVNEVNQAKKKASQTGGLRPIFQGSTLSETTIFLLPALDVKVHYNSKNYTSDSPLGKVPSYGSQYSSDSDANPVVDTASVDSGSHASTSKKSATVKRASLYAWMLLQTPPEEIVISPFLLDFLEQCLETIPIQPITSSGKGEGSESVGNVFGVDLEASATSLVSSSTYDYATFPVDVVVYLCVQPSLIRFSCLPLSRVECLLKLPTLDLALSSRKAADVALGASGSESGQSRLRSIFRSTPGSAARIRNMSGSRSRSNTAGSDGSTGSTVMLASCKEGGICFTACLSEFSLFIFHPYGGAHAKKLGPLDLGSITENPSASSFGRKDSLSLNVEFVRVNLSRSRRGQPISSETLTTAGSNARLHDSYTSVVCDVGSASFKYDMRRLTEILAFPKAWYRRSIARRLFLGDESAHMMYSDDSDTGSTGSSSIDLSLSGEISPNRLRDRSLRHSLGAMPLPLKPPSPITGFTSKSSRKQGSSTSSRSPKSPTSKPFPAAPSPTPTDLSPSSPTAKAFPPVPHPSPTDELPDEGGRRRAHTVTSVAQSVKIRISDTDDDLEGGKRRSKTPHTSTPSIQGGKAPLQWETTVLFAVSLTQLDVQMNMSNVMGNTTWSTRSLKSQGRLSIDSSGYKDMKISAGLGSSSLDAKGGVIGGLTELQDIDTFLHILEQPGKEPQHKAGAKMVKTEVKIDYMGSSVLMARLKLLEVMCNDEWTLNLDSGTETVVSTNRPMSVFVNTELTWDKFQMMLSRSTTPDLIKITYKLEEFFSQQFNNSKRVLSSLEPMASGRRSTRESVCSHEKSEIEERKHHRHWPGVASLISKVRLVKLLPSYPDNPVILGGHVSLRGNHASLACFHGVNFRSKSWALFTMREPEILYETEAQDILSEDGESLDTNIIQDLVFNLGHNQTTRAEYLTHYNFMATISRISRGRHNVPASVSSVEEWFHYACTTAGPEELEFFYREADQGFEPSNKRRKSLEYNHDSETLFALPKLQLEMRTAHLQKARPPRDEDPKPIVDVTFVTQFADHICVAMDVELILFLHDLVNSYINEKEKAFYGQKSSSFGKTLKSPDKEKKDETFVPGIVDWRDFNCKTWQLEPTLRLLSLGGRKIDPVGVDYVLQKLGFTHARVTIPKWIQRGAMDPVDKILSIVVKNLIRLMMTEEKSKATTTASQ
ncbi:bridge-like lipid transfer protein family member 1 [Glandiceps talaboti]